MKWTPDQLYHMVSQSQNESQWLYAIIRYLPHKSENDAPFYYRYVFNALHRQTPRQLMRLFPVSKQYDGARWQSKDYFTTMRMIHSHGIDNPISDAVSFLWDYVNPHTSAFLAGFFCAVDRARRAGGSPGLMESFAQQTGVQLHTYRPVTLGGRPYMQDMQSGSIIRVDQPKIRIPRWWTIIEGQKKEEPHP